jgi:hypothetical protein
MRLIKYTYARVRVERDGRRRLIDPGVVSEPARIAVGSGVDL